MNFLKNLDQKKLAKAVAFGLLVSGGMFAGMGQAYADAPKAWISGAEKDSNGSWIGQAGAEVRITAEEHTGAKPYEGGKIYGAIGEGKGNLNFEGGTFGDVIYGGIQEGNTITITGGDFEGCTVFGNDGNWGGNTITLCGGRFYNVYGSSAEKETKGNVINLLGYGGRLKIGEKYVENNGERLYIVRRLYGRNRESWSGVGNVLNVVGSGIHVGHLSNFEFINFYITKNVQNNDTMLDVGSGGEQMRQIIHLHNAKIRVGVETGSNLKVGDRVNLMTSALSRISGFNEERAGKLDVNDFKDYDFKYEFSEQSRLGSLAIIITSEPKPKEGVNSPVKSPVETQAAGLTMLTNGADMLAGKGFDNAASAVASEVSEGGSANTMIPFVTVGGAKTKVNSGSHIDVNGWHLNVGLAKELKNKSGKLLIGPVVEYGKGSYDSYLDNGFHGEGDTRYIGGGVMAKQTNNNGFYYEGSLRAGKLDNDYKSKGVTSNKYDTDSTYYAAHVGLGKIVKLSKKNTLDYYGKYFYTHQKGNDATLYTDGEPISMHFDGIDSNRTRLGARFTHALSEKNSVYAGLAWQHEFSGTARATMDAYGTPAPSVKGNTGIMELGWKVEAGKNLDLDLNATGYTGKQKGASMNLAVNFKF